MDEAFIRSLLRWLLERLAYLVAGTEAFGYEIIHGIEGPKFELLTHIRPDHSSEATLAAAQSAFIQIAMPCVQERKHGAIEIGTTRNESGSQFCLVLVIYDLNDRSLPRAVIGVITRCSDQQKAREKLVQMTNWIPSR